MTKNTEIILFGQLSQLAGQERLTLSNIKDTNELREMVNMLHPGVKDIDYVIAVGKKIVSENVAIEEGVIIALLPPFSGG